MTLLEFYHAVYWPQKHLASPATTVDAYLREIGALQKYADHERQQRGEPPRPLLVSDLSNELLARAMRWRLANDWSVPTANKLLRTISALWRFAHRRGLIATLPDLDRLREPVYEPQCWSLDEVALILEACARRQGRAPRRGFVGQTPAGIWWSGLSLMILSTGARISAVMALRTADVDLDAGRVLVRAGTQKNKRDQLFDIKPEVCEVLRAYQAHGRLERLFDDWPFDRSVVQWPALQSHYEQILRAAGLSDGAKDKFHKLRRTFATFVTAKAGEVAAQSLLGHSSIAVTRRYIDKSKAGGPSARELLPDFALPLSLQSALRVPDSAA